MEFPKRSCVSSKFRQLPKLFRTRRSKRASVERHRVGLLTNYRGATKSEIEVEGKRPKSSKSQNMSKQIIVLMLSGRIKEFVSAPTISASLTACGRIVPSPSSGAGCRAVVSKGLMQPLCCRLRSTTHRPGASKPRRSFDELRKGNFSVLRTADSTSSGPKTGSVKSKSICQLQRSAQ